MLTEIAVGVSIGLLFLVIYLIQLFIKQKRNLNRFQGVLDAEAEQERVKTTLEREQEIVRQQTKKLQTEAEKIQKNKTEAELALVSLKEQ